MLRASDSAPFREVVNRRQLCGRSGGGVAILMNHQLSVVVTKGARAYFRVERSLHPGCDAPGKQMAIDADLNAGLIDQEQQAAAPEVAQEAGTFTLDGRRQQFAAVTRSPAWPDSCLSISSVAWPSVKWPNTASSFEEAGRKSTFADSS